MAANFLFRAMTLPLRPPLVRSTYTSEEMKTVVGKILLVDTLALSRSFEAAGLDRKPAEQLALHITELIVSTKVKMEEQFVDKQQMSKINMEQEMRTSNFKNELQNSQSVQVTNMTKELERQQTFLDKMRAETRHEIDKLVASQRLDLNLEKGRMRDDLQMMRDKVTELEIKLDHDVNEVRSSVEKAKNDTIKSVITILGTFSAVAFTISRLSAIIPG
ncbi:hypothetical protein CEUSTIGMA_g3349.t1 [Chlamydomonas eustigma]|uniref:DUF1640 domain-containing protein n=1 Tax=Chlamydomonas eustigma TaxID=1157962 RepID=A0A250WYP5_9CHLO|nr:hypothetical protein CEUSTIGMA_g3349.t1 [Chlamydomonas eustigma]|eukprot:GAX75906.1 hypothetical protein CEUSTIGMA_g3349.t1 [Chlamydomonas eustigma]